MNRRAVHLDDMMPLILKRLNDGHSVTFSPRGVSMLPMLREGKDTVTLSPLPERLKKYDLPLYRRENGQYVLHRIVKVGESYTCIGDNQFRAEPGIKREQMIAVVTAFTRGKKQYSVNGMGYRLYCRFWHYSRFARRVVRGVKNRLKRILKRRGRNQ